MKQRQIIASLGALVAAGLVIYLVRRRKRPDSIEENTFGANGHRKLRTKAFSKAKSAVYEPDDHPE